MSTAAQYGRRVAHWLEFNRTGFRGRRYDPLRTSVAKWRLFAGWLFARSRDKDLNIWRSAVNRFLEDNGASRTLLGTSINLVIRRYRQLQVLRSTHLGYKVDLHRVPCPEIAIRRLVQIGQSATGDDLFWVCSLLVLFLCWFRAATLAGVRPGDVRFARNGAFMVSVREVKGRPELRDRPALVEIPDAPPGHPRHEVFGVLHRLLDSSPDALCRLGRLVSARAQGGATAANKLTAEFRRLVPPETLNLPAGAVVGSHSFREMGATTSIKARYSEALICDQGLWQRFATVIEHYYFKQFPFSQWAARVFDFLAMR